ncbi:hypothetical protein QVD17_13559 [Tagetes erecta]|uniref:Dof zinc finger protein n=1 Tax=Tagetes erecta TaxID=13708 RepID=A0AAD8KXY2_TARER|nr:hypothetical protein QVD17_13559 [Tagetes erecta]
MHGFSQHCIPVYIYNIIFICKHFKTLTAHSPQKPSKTFLLHASFSHRQALIDHRSQEIVMKTMDQILLPNTTNSSGNNNNNNNKNLSSSSSSFERRVSRPQKDAVSTPVNCPRCDSINTKFCYYNNYSLSQPRYFCKTCRRYWTAGGTLRNIPIGGGSRKNKRSSSSTTSTSKFPDLVVPSASTHVLSDQNPRIHHDQYGQDLNLGFPSNFKNVSEFIQVPNFNATQVTNSSALDLLTGTTTRGTTISDYNPVYTPMINPLSEFKIPTLSFALESNSVYGNDGFQESNGGKLLFPFEEMKIDSTLASHDDGGQSKDDQDSGSNGFWSGMMGGSNSW